MKIFTEPPKEIWESLAERPLDKNSDIESIVGEIILRVRKSGDSALKKLACELDGVDLQDGLVADKDFIEKSAALTDMALREAVDVACENIYRFHAAQMESDVDVETAPGVRCLSRSLPVQRVGLYVPGGSAPLFSTVLMLGIPAKIAGCNDIMICTPPGKDKLLDPSIAYAAKKAGINKIVFAGGAQAIAAMAYGTESVTKRDKIFGPGNSYVSKAKEMVSGDVAIDMVAGPSELMVIADETCDPDFVAADLLSQAEHGPDSQVVLLVKNRDILSAVLESLEVQKSKLSRLEIVTKSLGSSYAIIFNDIQDSVEFASLYAPEHLVVAVNDPWETAFKVTAAGSVFIGNYSPESAGDYASGTNHTLPTNGWARSVGGITTGSFMHKVSYQELSAYALVNMAPVIETMAENESLDAHKNAVSVRVNKLKMM